MKTNYNIYNQAEPARIYLGTVDYRKICVLNGIRPDSVNLNLKLNNTFDLSFTADRYIDAYGKEIESNGYDLLDEAMRIYVENIGWFIMQAPSIENDGQTESKSISAESAEAELLQRDLVGFKINHATSDSMEALVDGNYEKNDDGSIIIHENIKFYNEEKPELSLLHIILEAAKIKGWTIGEVDSTPFKTSEYADGEISEVYKMLPDEIGYFDISSQSVYAFLTQDVAQFFNCIILFDIQNFTINAYRAESLGTDTNITIGLRNLQNSNHISVNESSIYTRYRVNGGNDLDIRYVNFGEDLIENIDYKLNTRYLPQNLIDKYRLWKNDHELQREKYIELTYLYNAQLDIISELKDRVPLDDCSTDWYTFSLEKLQTIKEDYEAMRRGYEKLFTDENGLDYEALQNSDIAAEYNQIINYILENIQIAMENKVINKADDKKEYIEVLEWDLYGVDELNVMILKYEGQKEILEENGYGEEYQEGSEHTKDYHDTCYARYLKTLYQLDSNNADSCKAALIQRTQELNEAQALLDEYGNARLEVQDLVDKTKWTTEIDGQPISFSAKELSLLSSLYNDTDYTNQNIQLVSTDNQVTAIDRQLALYDAAVLDLEATSQPQYSYTTTLDNFLPLFEYRDYTRALNLGDFIWLGIRDDYQIKLRVISISFNPVLFDNQISIEFSNIIKSQAARNDFASLLSLNGHSGKNKISGSAANSGSVTGTATLQYLIDKVLNSTALGSKMNNSIQQTFGGYIGKLLVLKELEAEMIKTIDIEAENGFFQYLQSQLIVADQLIAESGDFKELSSRFAQIDSLLAGTVSAELGHVIRLTADNVSIDEAVIKTLIAAQINVADLKAGNISTNAMTLTSDDGGMALIGNTIQFKDKDGVIRIQIGRDTNDDFTFCLYDESGNGVLIDSEGIKESAVADGLVKTDMIADGAITETKLDKTNMLDWVDAAGNKIFDVANMYFGDDKFNVSYKSIVENVDGLNASMSGLSIKVDNVEKAITDKVWKSEIYDVIDEHGTVISKGLEDILVQTTMNVSGITSEVASVKSEFNNLQIGGTQILRGVNTDIILTSMGIWNNGSWRSASSGIGNRNKIGITDTPNANVKYGWELTKSSGNVDIAQDSIPVTEGQAYTLSCYARLISGSGKLRLQYGKNPYISEKFDITNSEWKKYSFTFTIGEVNDGSVNGTTNIYLGNAATGTIQICGEKLEVGTKSTDWSSSPEDTQHSLSEISSKIEQTVDSISSKVETNGVISAINQTAESLTIDASKINLNGAVTFSSFGSDLQNSMTSLSDSVTTLKSNVNSVNDTILDWCVNNNTTYIDGAKIYTGSIIANQLATNSITTEKLAASCITADKIAANTITANNISSNAITTDKINASAITAAKIATNAVTAEKINVTSLSAISANIGTVTAGLIKSTNYVSGSTGMQINLNATSGNILDSKNFKVAIDGTTTMTSANITGGTITNYTAGKKAIELLEHQIDFYDWANNGQFAGRLMGSHIGGSTSAPIMAMYAPYGFELSDENDVVLSIGGLTGNYINVDKINGCVISDTGWENLSYASGVSAGSYGGTFQYRKVSSRVVVKGGVSFTGASASKVVGTVPSGYRPTTAQYRLCAMTGSNVARIYINTSGSIVVEWTRKLSDGSWVTGAISWIAIYVEYFTDEAIG